MEVLLVSVGIHRSDQLLEPLEAGDSQDGDAAVAAKRLQQGEVDLQPHVVFIVGCQDAQHHAVWIPEEERGNEKTMSALADTWAHVPGTVGLGKVNN